MNLGFTQVRSLIDGIAGIAMHPDRQSGGPTTVLTTVSQVDPIKVYFSISEQEYLALAGSIARGRQSPICSRQGSDVPLQLTLVER